MTHNGAAAPEDVCTRTAEPVNSTGQAYDAVRRAIINAELRPGQIVSQVRLAAQLNVSRTPLREALRRLQSEGLLEGDFNRRLRVAPLSIGDLEQVAAMRITLESLAVRSSVPRLSDADLTQAATAYEEMDAAWFAGRFDDFRLHHKDFHTTLFGAVGDRLQAQLHDLWDHAERYRTFYQKSTSDQRAMGNIGHDEHGAILQAAQRREAQQCGHLVATHLARTALTAIAYLDATYDPTIIREATTVASGCA